MHPDTPGGHENGKPCARSSSSPDIRRPHPAIFIRFHDPIAAALKVCEDSFRLYSLDVLIAFRLWAGPTMHKAHADSEKNVVALSLEGHAAMFALCSLYVKPHSVRLVERYRSARRAKKAECGHFRQKWPGLQLRDERKYI